MESSTVIDMNKKYKEITGEEPYLYTSSPRGGTLYVFANAQIPNHQAAGRHMRLMLEAALRGMRHQDIVSRFKVATQLTSREARDPKKGRRGQRRSQRAG